MSGRNMYEPLAPTPDWTPDERPTIPGSPSTPYHAPATRAAYALIGLLVGLTGGLGNALVSANLQQIQGEFALTPVQGTWLPAAFVMVNVSSNLILFKCRQQFGITRFAEVGILAYVAITILHLLVHDYQTALIVRAVSGFAAAPMSALGIFYILQAFPKAYMGQGLCVALGISQLAIPLAWLLSPALLDLGEWQALYLFELGLALCSFGAVHVLKLPPGIRIQVFQRIDFLTFALLAPAIGLFVAVLAQGRTQWWTEQPWIAWALIVSLALFLIAFMIEHHRRYPLIQTRWLGTAEVARFALGALVIRFLLSEQTFGAIGMLRTLGMGPDQLRPLYAVILIGTVAGFTLSALTFGPKTIVFQLLGAVVLIITGGAIDANATSQIRPHDLFFSQFLLSCAAGLFMGPMLLIGVMRALARGADHIVTFAVLFSITQSVGGLAGPALFGTFQQFREHEYSAAINAGVDPTDPVVAGRLAAQRQVYNRVITDPVRRAALGTGLLARSATIEANVRAYNDVFRLNSLIAILFLIWSLVRVVMVARQSKAAPPPPSAASAVAV